MTKQRVFHKSYAAELVRIARADLEAAQILIAGKASRREIIFFQIEQSIEKSLKAYLCKLGIAVPLTHDLNVILDRFPKQHPIPHADVLEDLIEFATVRRYEEGAAILTDEELTAAIKVANDIVTLVEAAVSKP